MCAGYYNWHRRGLTALTSWQKPPVRWPGGEPPRAALNCTRASRRLQFAPATACWSRQPPCRFPGQLREAVFAA